MLICKYSLYDDIKKSVVSKRQLSVVLLASFIVVSLVSTVLLGTPAFAQNQTDTDDKTIEQATKAVTPELERMTFRVNFSGDDCTIPEKFDIIPLSKCENNHMTISILPEHARDLFKMDSGISPGKPDYFKTDMSIFNESVKYFIQKNNVISERALGNDVADTNPKIVKTIIHVDTKNCVFPEKLGLNKTEFNCKQSKMVVHIPSSSITDLIDLDFVKKITQYQKPCPECYLLPMPIEELIEKPIISKQQEMSSNNIDIGLYHFVLISIVTICLTALVYLQYRKKEKIEA